MSAIEVNKRERFGIPLNGTELRFDDRSITVRQALIEAGMTPPSEYQAVLAISGRTRHYGTDDELDLKGLAGAALWAERGDRVFAFTLDEVGQVWCAQTIAVDRLRDMLEVADDHDLVLEREEEGDVLLRSGGTVSFGPDGVEDIVTRPRHGPEFVAVTVFTTSGTFPAEGALRVRSEAPVRRILERAANRLELGDTSQWVVTVDGRDIDPDRSFAENGLSGAVEIEWNPREGGGGA
jgi:hypothetical protein